MDIAEMVKTDKEYQEKQRRESQPNEPHIEKMVRIEKEYQESKRQKAQPTELQKTEAQKEMIMMWVGNIFVSENTTKNRFKKESIKTHNRVLIEMATWFCNHIELPEEVIKQWIIVTFFGSNETAKRYIDRIKTFKYFNYESNEKVFTLPDDLQQQIVSIQ